MVLCWFATSAVNAMTATPSPAPTGRSCCRGTWRAINNRCHQMNWARISHCVVALLCRLPSCSRQTSTETNHHHHHHPHHQPQWHRCKNCTEQNAELGRRCSRWSHAWKCVWFWGFPCISYCPCWTNHGPSPLWTQKLHHNIMNGS